jgi:hypothetical protein
MLQSGLKVTLVLALLAPALGTAQAQRMWMGMPGQARMAGMPGPGMCKRGMPHHVCVDRCVALGGVGRGPPNPMCSHRCTRMGCQSTPTALHPPH